MNGNFNVEIYYEPAVARGAVPFLSSETPQGILFEEPIEKVKIHYALTLCVDEGETKGMFEFIEKLQEDLSNLKELAFPL